MRRSGSASRTIFSKPLNKDLTDLANVARSHRESTCALQGTARLRPLNPRIVLSALCKLAAGPSSKGAEQIARCPASNGSIMPIDRPRRHILKRSEFARRVLRERPPWRSVPVRTVIAVAERHSAAEPQPMLEFTLQRAAGHTLKRELQQNRRALQRIYPFVARRPFPTAFRAARESPRNSVPAAQDHRQRGSISAQRPLALGDRPFILLAQLDQSPLGIDQVQEVERVGSVVALRGIEILFGRGQDRLPVDGQHFVGFEQLRVGGLHVGVDVVEPRFVFPAPLLDLGGGFANRGLAAAVVQRDIHIHADHRRKLLIGPLPKAVVTRDDIEIGIVLSLRHIDGHLRRAKFGADGRQVGPPLGGELLQPRDRRRSGIHGRGPTRRWRKRMIGRAMQQRIDPGNGDGFHAVQLKLSSLHFGQFHVGFENILLRDLPGAILRLGRLAKMPDGRAVFGIQFFLAAGEIIVPQRRASRRHEAEFGIVQIEPSRRRFGLGLLPAQIRLPGQGNFCEPSIIQATS